MAENPFFEPSTLPYGLPPFALIREEHYLPAFERGMADQLREVREIADNPEPATFANTIEALERSGRILKRTVTVFSSISASDTTDGIREIETQISPRLTQHADAIRLDRALYARIRQVTTDDPEEAWLLQKYRVDFVRAGADLSESDQDRLRGLNEELARLATTFSQNLLTASTASALVVEDVKLLDGLAESTIKAIEKDGGYVLPLFNYTNQPALAELTDRETRRRLYELSVGRAPENFELAARMATLRAERAALLGFRQPRRHCVADQTARTTAPSTSCSARWWARRWPTPAAEAEALRASTGRRRAGAVGLGVLLPSRCARPSATTSTPPPAALLRAGPGAAGRGLPRRRRAVRHRPSPTGTTWPATTRDVRVWEVSDADGSPLGLFLGRPLRPASQARRRLDEQPRHPVARCSATLPVVVNNLNITKPAEGEPTLLTLRRGQHAFHEFGHALHGLFSDVRYPRFSGTAVPRDFVEFPSQVNEMWVTWPEVLAQLRQARTRPASRARGPWWSRCGRAEKFGRGIRAPPSTSPRRCWTRPGTAAPEAEIVEDAEAFERRGPGARRDRLSSWSRPLPEPTTSAHLRSGAGSYSAGYYSYIWSEVLDADTRRLVQGERRPARATTATTFRVDLLSVGGSMDAMEAFRDFRGRDPRIEPLLERRGLLR